jgi:hypothetical protein
MAIQRLGIKRLPCGTYLTAVGLLLSGSLAGAVNPVGESFASPQEAARRLVRAVEKDDTASLLRILGPSAKPILVTQDKVSDMRARERFLTKAQERMVIIGDPTHPGWKLIEMGTDHWPFPVPLVKTGGRWRFDVDRGKREILLRRIGENELTALDVCRGYVEAQNEYYERNPEDASVKQYAQMFISSPGKRDGLYWQSSDSGDESPIGEFVARAMSEGYVQRGESYHGYRFRILNEQGPQAPGGKMSYLEDGGMTRGFAMIAWPSDYRSTGVMTFIVDRSGIVYERDLGPNTAKTAAEIRAYNPDDTWRPVAGSGVPEPRRSKGTASRSAR